jgi:hypothetical protein
LRLLLTGVLLGLGCGRVGYQSVRAPSDGATDGPTDANGDGAVEPPHCEWASGPPSFGAIEHLANVNGSSGDFDPSLSADERTLYFATRRDGIEEIYVSTRNTLADDFSNPVPFTEANSAEDDTRFVESSDGREGFVVSSRPGTLGGADIFLGSRNDTSMPFSGFTSIPLVNTGGDEFDPFLTADGLTLYFAPDARPDAVGGQDVYVSVRTGGTFSAGVPVPVINSTSGDFDPSVSANGRVIVFNSERTGTARIFYATRASSAVPFGTPLALPTLLSEPAIIDPFMTLDGCSIYFTSTRPDSLGQSDLYRIRATPSP